MHRNTLLFVAFLAVIAALVVGVQIGRRTTLFETTTVPSPTIHPTPTGATLLYSNKDCGISLSYPNSLQQIESSLSGTILASVTTPSASVIIICQKDIPRVPLPPEKIETITFSGISGGATVSAKLYHDASARDGTPIDKLIFTNPNTGIDVFIGGFGDIFNELIRTIKLL